jgi:Ca-activated chloride channel family protein
VPHVLSPITEDTYTILNALPALSTDLARLQGSRLHQALDRAETLLESLPEDSARSILLISDGDFDEPDLIPRIEKLAQQGIKLHVLSVGTRDGARVPAQQGGWIVDRTGQPVRSALNEEILGKLAEAGQGNYQRADFRDDDTEEILEAAAATRLPPEASGERTRIWNERYYLPVLALAALLAPQFRGRTARRRRK